MMDKRIGTDLPTRVPDDWRRARVAVVPKDRFQFLPGRVLPRLGSLRNWLLSDRPKPAGCASSRVRRSRQPRPAWRTDRDGYGPPAVDDHGFGRRF